METPTPHSTNSTTRKTILGVVIVLIVALIVILQVHESAGRVNVPAGSADIPLSIGGSCSDGTCIGTSTSATGTAATATPQGVLSSQSQAGIAAAVSAGYLTPQEKISKYPRAKEIVAPSGFINSPLYDPATNGSSTAPFKIADLVGKKVILVDFWTYSCINCQRTIPYLDQWYSKYKDAGLEIVGIHTPEFDFEKDYGNVTAAVMQYGIHYPVVLDNNMGTWSAYGNLYWPHEYLIDIDGFIVHDHIGEGDYDATEKEIQSLLTEKKLRDGSTTTIPTSLVTEAAPQTQTTPETYFGSARNEYLLNGSSATQGVQNLTYSSSDLSNLYAGGFYLSGTWDFFDQYAENQSAAQVGYDVVAKNVYMVASADKPTAVDVYLDGKFERTITVQAPQLYTLVTDGNGNTPQTLELKIAQAGLQAYTFTFGS